MFLHSERAKQAKLEEERPAPCTRVEVAIGTQHRSLLFEAGQNCSFRVLRYVQWKH